MDAPLRSFSSSSPCLLSNVLEQAGARAEELVANLQNFTAQEKIEYQLFGNVTHLLGGGTGTFNYIVVFDQGPEGVSVQESRTPRTWQPRITCQRTGHRSAGDGLDFSSELSRGL